MGIGSSLLIGVSGLSSNAEAMSTISNNIANVNTTAYKKNGTSFQQLVAGKTSDGATGAFNGTGVVNKIRQFISQAGTLQRTNQPTDLAVAGNGFFVVSDKSTGLTPTDVRSFTRLGDFQADPAGYLKNSNGQYLLGWPQDTLGNIDYDVSDLNKLSPIKVTGLSGIAVKSTAVSVGANINDATAISADAAIYTNTPTPPATVNNMALYAADPTKGTKPDFEISIPVIDSKGNTRSLTLSVLKKAANEWYAEIRGKDAELAGDTNGLITAGLLKFTPDGTLDAANSTLFGAAGAKQLTIGASSAGTGLRWASTLGVDSLTLNFDLATAFRQNAGVTQVTNVTTDGKATGNLQEIAVDSSGTVSAVFNNGAVVGLATIALATFNNSDGLSVSTGGSLNQTFDSGNFNLKVPGLGGAGIVASRQLEASNVDLTSEFTGLITTQRAYSASSKIITTADQMLDELISIKR
jgi:flagellar hook protein FlgE